MYWDRRTSTRSAIDAAGSVTVRNIEKKYEPISFIENYYDDQRFSGKNHFIGKALARNEWSKAAAILRLKAEGNDFIGALRNGVTRRMLVFYLNAYQSYLWNEVVRLYLSSKYEYKWDIGYQAGNFVFSNESIMNKIVPILGYLTQLRDPTIKNVYEELMVKEGITKEAFKFIPMPEIRSEGNERDMIVRLPDLKLNYLKDSKNYSCKLSFTLPPGSYATMVVKKMFCDRNL